MMPDSGKQESEAKLILTREGQLLNEYPIKKECFSIGRGEDNNVHLTDKKVSRVHARILSDSEGHFLEDLNSTNGTFVNEKRISKHTLREGDVIKIGKYRLSYKPSLDFSDSQSKSVDTKVSQLELDDWITDKKRIPVDITTLDFETTSIDVSQTKAQRSGIKISEKILDSSPPEKPSQKRDLGQALKTLEDLLG